MCGIAGIYGFTHADAAEDAIRRMTGSIAHRGPDAEGFYSGKEVKLGHRRLAIIDISSSGNQPLYSQDRRKVLVFNGEIYNYLELRDQLRDHHTFTTSSDTEVVMAAYERWGIECVDHFVGMFAFALWDDDSGNLFLVRDRLGVKPLYCFWQDGMVLFASEIRALLSSGMVPSKLNQESLPDYLMYQTVHAPATIIQGITMIMPGTYLKIRNGVPEEHVYWTPARNAAPVMDDEKTVRRRIREKLLSSVEMRMRADVNFGAFLSGGIDSSAIVGLMNEIAPGRVNTFSVTFYEKEFDEGTYSSAIAKRFNTQHTEARVSASMFLDLLPQALSDMDHPGGDGPNTWVVSRLTREHGIRMALSGIGGDELFAGYEVFRRMSRLQDQAWLKVTPGMLRRATGAVLAGLKPSVATEKLRDLLSLSCVDFAGVYPITRQVMNRTRADELLSSPYVSVDPVSLISRDVAILPLSLLSRVSVAEMTTYMQNVLLRDTDQMSMAHALEVREPFLDHRLVEYVLGVPDNQKYPHTPKRLLTESLEGLLPDEIIHRPKMGFTFPWAIWMRNELREKCHSELNFLAQTGYFNPEALSQVWRSFLEQDPRVTWSRVWHLVVLGHWMRENQIH